jgi:phosphate transport system permease protein
MSESANAVEARIAANLRRRYRAERRFKAYGLVAVTLSLLFVVFLFTTIISKGYSGFRQTYVQLEVEYTPDRVDPEGRRAPADLAEGDYLAVIKAALRAQFPEVTERSELRKLYGLLSQSAEQDLRKRVVADPALVGQRERVWVLARDSVDQYAKGQVSRAVPEEERAVSDQEMGWIDALTASHRLEKRFNWRFFSSGDSREPEQAGVLGAVKGSFYTLLVTIVLSFPIGVAAAVYLEEFAVRNRFTDVIEVNINNLAAVPSIIFGLLGLAVFLNFFGLPRSAPVVGGLVLALLVLPTVIIASRAALKAVPPSITEAALGVGASKQQAVFQHVLPLALPGIMTGTILGLARAFGETAPLLMIGMVAFIADVPQGFTSAATVLPVQVFLWSDLPELAFKNKTAAAIIVLLVVLFILNAAAIYLRKRFERRW